MLSPEIGSWMKQNQKCEQNDKNIFIYLHHTTL